jgi:hypothetical protein
MNLAYVIEFLPNVANLLLASLDVKPCWVDEPSS